MKRTTSPPSRTTAAATAYALVPVVLAALGGCSGKVQYTPYVPPKEYGLLAVGGEEKRLGSQTGEQVAELNANCTAAGCHVSASDPHEFPTFRLACVDCHGGDPAATTKEEAHPRPRHPDRWRSGLRRKARNKIPVPDVISMRAWNTRQDSGRSAVRSGMEALLPRLRRFARGLAGNAADADDLVQAACVKALCSADGWTIGTRLDSWLYRIVHTTWLDELRRRRHRHDGVPRAGSGP